MPQHDFLARIHDALYTWEYAQYTNCWVYNRVFSCTRENILRIPSLPTWEYIK